MARIDHVNLPVASGQTAEVVAFYERVLGFTPAARPETARVGAWLDVGDGRQVHLTEREGAAHPEQHVAFVVGDLDAVRDRAVELGAPWDELSAGRAKLRDPAGNLVELFAEGSPRA